ncbi:MAG: NAD(P)-dependent oxidoreductase [Pseudomonadales bacterium]|jgi:3-hydroxyisobutyrate dehydrogenase-like beta-hydroxyacid dehydrogenase
MSEKVGILGLGLIGRLVAELLVPHGYECYAVRRPSTENFPETGGTLVDTPRELAEVSDIVVSTLPSVDAAREAFAGRDGVVAGAHDGLIIIEMNTFPLAIKEELRHALDDTRAVIIDCPISGTQPIIRAGNGVIMMSGDEAACERVTSMLILIAPNTSYVGEYGTGIKLKLMINFMVGAHTVALAEGMLFGAEMGLDTQTMLNIVGASAAGSTVFGIRAGIIAERNWQPCAGPSKLLWKDLDIIEQQADVLGLSAPLLRVCNQYYKKVAAAGRLEDECGVVFEILENEINAPMQ